MNNQDRWQLYLYENNIICNACFQSGKITCDKCRDAIKRHVMSGEAVGWDAGMATEEDPEDKETEEELAAQRERNRENPEWRYYHPRGEE